MISFIKKYWAVFNPDLIPTSYREGDRPLHNDWLPGFRWVPRKWSMWFLPMPPKQFAGNAHIELVPIQKGYPLASDANVVMIDGVPHMYTPHPVLPVGYWSIQSVEIPGHGYAPCYFTCTFPLFGRHILFSFGLKPDVTTDPNNPDRVGDMHWGFPEVSFRSRLFTGESA